MAAKPRSLCRLLVLLVPLLVGCSDSRSPLTGGQALYASRCAFCHGDTGRGDGHIGIALKPAPRDFTNPKFWEGRTRASLEKAILTGVPGSAMSSHRGTMSDEELRGLIDYLMLLRPDDGDAQDGEEQEQ